MIKVKNVVFVCDGSAEMMMFSTDRSPVCSFPSTHLGWTQSHVWICASLPDRHLCTSSDQRHHSLSTAHAEDPTEPNKTALGIDNLSAKGHFPPIESYIERWMIIYCKQCTAHYCNSTDNNPMKRNVNMFPWLTHKGCKKALPQPPGQQQRYLPDNRKVQSSRVQGYYTWLERPLAKTSDWSKIRKIFKESIQKIVLNPVIFCQHVKQKSICCCYGEKSTGRKRDYILCLNSS